VAVWHDVIIVHFSVVLGAKAYKIIIKIHIENTQRGQKQKGFTGHNFLMSYFID
jgi:uncharacterized membrane protein